MENTRKIVIGMYAGFAGTSAYEFYVVPANITDEELSDFAWHRGIEHAEMYGVYSPSEYTDTEDYDEDSDDYSDNIDGWWEPYDSEKHDGHSMNGTPSWNTY